MHPQTNRVKRCSRHFTRPNEAAVLRAVKDLLAVHQNAGRLVFRRLNVGPKLRNTPHGVKFLPNPEMVGLPDLLIWPKGAPTMCWEVKSPDGVQTVGQKLFEGDVRSVGHEYFLIRSVDDAVRVLAQHGITDWSYPAANAGGANE